ncbi:MAG: hypothetical protein F4035_04390, partial [Acidimicrobiia bacterium]|nr:hypothetical protein [Acidimicrobiia bacterium]
MLSLNSDTLERLNAAVPASLASRRREALREYGRLDMPGPKEENWKYVALGFDLDNLAIPVAPGDSLPEGDFLAALTDRAGSAVMVDGKLTGVVNHSEAWFGSATEAWEAHPPSDL